MNPLYPELKAPDHVLLLDFKSIEMAYRGMLWCLSPRITVSEEKAAFLFVILYRVNNDVRVKMEMDSPDPPRRCHCGPT